MGYLTVYIPVTPVTSVTPITPVSPITSVTPTGTIAGRTRAEIFMSLPSRFRKWHEYINPRSPSYIPVGLTEVRGVTKVRWVTEVTEVRGVTSVTPTPLKNRYIHILEWHQVNEHNISLTLQMLMDSWDNLQKDTILAYKILWERFSEWYMTIFVPKWKRPYVQSRM